MAKLNGSLAPKKAILRIGPTMGIPQALKSLGLDPEKIIVEAGFSMALFDDPENLITFSDRGRLLAYCANEAQCSYFGLLVGQYSGLQSLGFIGLLMKCSTNVEKALDNLTCYFNLYFQGSTVTLQTYLNTSVLSYHVNENDTKGTKQVGAGAVASIYNILAELCGPKWAPEDVFLMQKEPLSIKPYQRVFKQRPRFNASQNSVSFSSAWLKFPLPGVDPVMRSLVQSKIDSMERVSHDSFPDQVRKVLRETLLSGSYSVSKVSYVLSMHPRTINRKLSDYALHYKELVDEIRFEIAQRMLEDTDLNINTIAINLDYSDARSFIRAFKRWSSETPARWRASKRVFSKA